VKNQPGDCTSEALPDAACQWPAVWIDGERLRADTPHVSAYDRGLTLADGLFETMRARGRSVFRLDRHLARLRDGLNALEITAPPKLRSWVLDAVHERTSDEGDLSVRLTVTRGAGGSGLAPPAGVRATVAIVVNPLPQFPSAIYEVGLTAHVASGRRNERAMTAGLKTLAYTDAIAAWLEARRAGADEALFLDSAGHCSEATSSNLFAWTGSTLITPPLSCGALPGITRAAVFELAAARGVPAEEREFGLDELFGAEEAFLTSSLRGLAPLVRIGTRPIGLGVPGALTRAFAEAYDALIAAECRL
jgi:branched-chain amino acid aminotransferase